MRFSKHKIFGFFLFSLAVMDTASANPGFASSISLKTSVGTEAIAGPFRPSPILRERVDFWKDVFTKYGRAHSVIHHRDFPQIVFGVIDLTRERDVMSDVSFEAYKTSVVQKTTDDVKSQMLALHAGQDARTPFQERLLEQLSERELPVAILKAWIDEDLIRTQTGIRERYAEAIRRAWRYLPAMEQIFEEYGLPKELTRIPFIESSFDYSAYSSVGAAGIWQFMPRTARERRMLISRHVDERRDPLRATRAAAEYLRSAYNSLGSWPLAITSYNHGVGGVRSKVRKAGTEDLSRIIEDPHERYFGFASTNFYPEFLAAVEIFSASRDYFPEVKEEPPLRVVSYPLRRSIPARAMAAQLGMAVEELREANYGLLETVWRGKAAIPSGYTLRVPIAHKQRADHLLGLGVIYGSDGKDHSAGSFIVDNGQLPAESKVGGNPQVVKRDDNRVASTKRTQDVYNRSINTQVRRNQVKRFVLVKSGDTLSSLSKRHGVGIDSIKRLNKIKGNTVVIGDKLLLP